MGGISRVVETGSRSSSSLQFVALVKPSPNSVAKREPHEKAMAVDGCELLHLL